MKNILVTFCFLFFLGLSSIFSPSLAQSSKDVKKAASEKNIEKLINIYDKASKKQISYLQREVVEAIEDIDNPAFFDALELAFQCEYIEIRKAAIKAYGKMNDPRAINLIIVALDDEVKKVRQTAVYTLAKTNNLLAARELSRRSMLDNSNGEKTALRRMDTDILLELIDDQDPLVRSGVAQALGRYKNYTAYDPLINALDDESAMVRKSALIGLAGMRDTLPMKRIITIAITDADEEVKEEASNALLNAKADPRAEEIYITALGSDKIWMKEKAATRIIELETPRALEFYSQASIVLLDNKNEMVRFKAAKTLVSSKDSISNDVLDKAHKIINEKSYVEVFIMFDKYGRKAWATLDNIDGNPVVTKKYEYHKFNGSLISQTVTIELSSRDTLRITNFNEYGRQENYMYLCLDKNGNLIKEGEKPILVELFNATQKTISKISYKGLSKREKLNERMKIYPCQDCAEESHIDSCRFVW